MDKNITFDDIHVAPLEDPYASRRSYVRPTSMLVPPVPIPAIPPYPSASSEHVNGYNGIYRPTTDSTHSLSIPQPVPPIHRAPAQPPLSQVDPQHSEYPIMYPPVDDPGRNVDTANHGSTDGNPPEPPIHISNPVESTIMVDKPQAAEDGLAAGVDEMPQSVHWNTGIRLAQPVRRPTDDSWVDIDDNYLADTRQNVYPSAYPPFFYSDINLEYAVPVRNEPGLWSRAGSVFRGLLPKKMRIENASAIDLESQKARYRATAAFVGKTLPRQIYLHLLLRLPSLYFSRVARIFEEADLTLPELKKMALETASQVSPNNFDPRWLEAGIDTVPPQYERLKMTWESFIDSVMREWKTFNIISVLLLSCVLFCSALHPFPDGSTT